MKKKFFSTAVLVLMLVSCNQNSKNQQVDKQKNETIETILSRRSIRVYKPNEVPQNLLNTIILAAINAPSARNLQPWEMRVIKNRELIAKIESGVLAKRKAQNPDIEPRSVFHGAPVLMVVAYDRSNPFGQLDCGWFGQNILLAAHSLGLGTCAVANANDFFNSSEGKSIVEKLNFSENYEIIYAVTLGYPDETPVAKSRDAEKVRIIE
jgi:nitroreductase